MQCGRATIVSGTGTYLDVPEDVVVRVSAGRLEPAGARGGDPRARSTIADRRRRIGEAARAHTAELASVRGDRARLREAMDATIALLRDPARRALARWGGALVDLGITEDGLSDRATAMAYARALDEFRPPHAREDGANPRILHSPRSRSAANPVARLATPAGYARREPDRPRRRTTEPMAATTQTVERTSESPHLRVGERLRVLVAHREILANLVRKELKVKYTASVLGAVWSLLNPLVYLAVFTFVAKVLGAGIPDFPVYLLSGLLAWNLFSASLNSGASRSVLDNANLVKKVAFPREILPLAAVGVGARRLRAADRRCCSLYIVVSGYGLHLPELALWPLAFVDAPGRSRSALTLWFSALNVRYRDVGHLLNIALLVWFWVTPIVYAEYQVQELAEGRRLARRPAASRSTS